MFDWSLYLATLSSMAAFAAAGWLYSVVRRNVTIVDSMWSLFFFIGIISINQSFGGNLSERGTIVFLLVTLWSFRLAGYLTWRNWGPHEDRRYQAIRKNNEPHFWLKSIYIVFGLQAVLAWVISLPLFGASLSWTPLGPLDFVGVTVWIFGFLWESIGDLQLARFKSDPKNSGKVMDRGLWRYSRHPNYFGECVLWWGYYLIACSGGAWWSLPAPLLMTFLLLKVSGVSLLEKDISERRPEYQDYIARTNAFIPGRRKA